MSLKTDEMLSIGRLANAAGVSTQTIRIWEKRGYFTSDRSVGGHRVFDPSALSKAKELAVASRRAGKQHLPDTADQVSIELSSTGMRIRRARLGKGLSQQMASERIGISRSFLASVERGESGVSVNTLAKMADVFGIPMSQFAADTPLQGRVMRLKDRPRTHLAGGVMWEELAEPSRHDLEPALLHIPPGQNSGGMLIRPGESFVSVLSGSLLMTLGELKEEITLDQGDSIVIDGGTAVAWCNTGKQVTTCMWVELIGSLKSKPAK